jgi:hypothetical protein
MSTSTCNVPKGGITGPASAPSSDVSPNQPDLQNANDSAGCISRLGWFSPDFLLNFCGSQKVKVAVQGKMKLGREQCFPPHQSNFIASVGSKNYLLIRHILIPF